MGVPAVVVFVPNLEGGGMERVAVDLANGMSRAGADIQLVVSLANGPYRSDIAESVRLVDLDCGRVRAAVVPLARLLRCRPPDALLSIGFHANVAAWGARKLSRRAMRLVGSQHNLLGPELAGLAAPERAVMSRLLPRAYRGSDAVVAVSSGVRDHLTQVLGDGLPPIPVIQNPVSLVEVRAKSREAPGHRWFSDGGPPIVICVGRLVPEKDHPTLLRAVRIVRTKRPLRLLLLGEGPERPAVQALVESLGLVDCVDLPGFLPNPYASLARAALLVLSSRREGLGVVLIEALALGTPIVATDCQSGPAEILRGGELGALVPVGDVAAMADAIERVLDGRQPVPSVRAADRYDIETVTASYLTLLVPAADYPHRHDPAD